MLDVRRRTAPPQDTSLGAADFLPYTAWSDSEHLRHRLELPRIALKLMKEASGPVSVRYLAGRALALKGCPLTHAGSDEADPPEPVVHADAMEQARAGEVRDVEWVAASAAGHQHRTGKEARAERVGRDARPEVEDALTSSPGENNLGGTVTIQG